MSNFTVPNRGEVSENNQAIFDNLKSALGMVPNLYAAMAHSDTALENYLAFQNGETSFNKKEKEVVNLVVSQFNDCDYCLAAHTMLGEMNGFTNEQILELRAAKASWDLKTQALVKLASAIAERKGNNVNQELKEFYDAGYNRGNLVDLVLLIADKVVMNYLHNITNVPVDFPEAVVLEKKS